jgi:flagellar hook assembly protein FlgD
VQLTVYNILGEKVADILDNNLPAGYYKAEWNGVDNDGRPASSGLYLYRLVTPTDAQTRKMLLLK